MDYPWELGANPAHFVSASFSSQRIKSNANVTKSEFHTTKGQATSSVEEENIKVKVCASTIISYKL